MHDIRGSFFREQAIAVRRHGCEVGVIALRLVSLKERKSALLETRDVTHESDEGVNTYRKDGVNWFPRLPKAQAHLWRRYGLDLFNRYTYEHGKPDVIHVHSMLNAGLIAEEIRRRYRIPYVLTEHSSAFARGKVSAPGKNYAARIASNAAAKFAVSSALARLLDAFFEDSASPWRVLPNIVNKDFFASHDARGDKNDFAFLSICLLTYNKRVDLLISAFAQAFRGRQRTKLRIGGDGVERGRLEAVVRQLRVADQVEFLGELSRAQVIRAMARADAFVLSSEYETFGLVIAEALALGKPVVSTRCGGPEDIVREQDGILVPKNDISAMAQALQAMYEHHQAYQAAEIRQACKERFSEEVIAQRLFGIYSKVFAKPSE